MRLVSISNNFGEKCDGIGDYAALMKKYLPAGVEDIVYSAHCDSEWPKCRRFVTLGMTRAIFKALSNFEKDHADVYLIEYPFMEWNFLILLPMFLLSKKARPHGKLFALSVHEYNRAHFLRKLIIRWLCPMADLLFVSTEEIRQALVKYCSRCYIRELPSNIWDDTENTASSRSQQRFVYFGLVNHAKAFDEMLKGWDQFNNDGKYELTILSATKLEGIEKEHVGVRYIYNAENGEILQTMRQSTFSLLPIRPEIDMKNGSFKASTVAGCVCIGRFSADMSGLPFAVQMDDYVPEDFLDAMQRAVSIAPDRLEEMVLSSSAYGKQFGPSKAFEKIVDTIQKVIDTSEKS